MQLSHLERWNLALWISPSIPKKRTKTGQGVRNASKKGKKKKSQAAAFEEALLILASLKEGGTK